MMDAFVDREVRDISAGIIGSTLGIVLKSLFGADPPGVAGDIGRLMLAVLDGTNHRLNTVLRIPSRIPTRRNLGESRAAASLGTTIQFLIRARPANDHARGRNEAAHGEN